MGRLRVDTISKILETPNMKEEILASHKEMKAARLNAKAILSPQDLFDACERAQKSVERQLLIAQSYRTPLMKSEVLDQTPFGAARASEDFTFVLAKGASYFEETKTGARIETLAEILDLLSMDIEPVVRRAIHSVFKVIYERTPQAERREKFIQPLAVAISNRFYGSALDKGHRENAEMFINDSFKDEAVPLAKSLKAEFGVGHRKALAALKEHFKVADD